MNVEIRMSNLKNIFGILSTKYFAELSSYLFVSFQIVKNISNSKLFLNFETLFVHDFGVFAQTLVK